MLSDAQGPILIATDIMSDANLVRKLLAPEFENVAISTTADAAARDFERIRPQVLLLAFNTLEKAQRYYLGLYRFCQVVHGVPHRTLILCGKEDLRPVYELCRKEFFDDYILFWPLSHDGPRLLMSVHLAFRALRSQAIAPVLSDFAAEARQAAGLEGVINTSLQEALESPQPVRQWAQDFGAKAEPHRESVRRLGSMAGQIRPLVLVVEDDEFQLKIVAAMLSGQDCDLVTATSATAALAQVGRQRPDLMFLDVGLPDINGVDVLRRLQASPGTAMIPIVMMTGHSERQVVLESMSSGARGFIAKPFERALLLRKMNEILDAPSPERLA